MNPQVANPHLIYPGDRLALVYIDGKPRITKVATSDVVKLSPQVRSEAIDTPIPAIPLDAIASFLTDTRIVSPEELNGAPYVLGRRQPHHYWCRRQRPVAKPADRGCVPPQ